VEKQVFKTDFRAKTTEYQEDINMIRALQTSASGMNAQQINLDNIANNLANVSTTGFKRGVMGFNDLIYQNSAQPGAPSAEGAQLPVGIQIGLGTRPVSANKHFSQGVLIQTDNPLDLAIQGEGFFQITLPDGSVAYSRDGSFKIDGEGNMVTAEGFKIDPAITFPTDATNITVGLDGTISALTGGSTTPQEIGKVQLVRFTNSAGLLCIGKNLYKETPASGSPVIGTPGEQGMGSLTSGYLEASNVDVVREMVEMIRAERAYQINSRVVRGADEMLQTVADIKR
jgi:flagellar basal-body rod protein FlgG